MKGTVTDMSFPCLSRALRNGRPSRLVTCCLPHDLRMAGFVPVPSWFRLQGHPSPSPLTSAGAGCASLGRVRAVPLNH